MTPTPEEARALAERLMKSWDADQSIIRQTDMWMRERRDAADTITAMVDEVERLEEAIETMKAQAAGTPAHPYCAMVIATAESALKGADQ